MINITINIGFVNDLMAISTLVKIFKNVMYYQYYQLEVGHTFASFNQHTGKYIVDPT